MLITPTERRARGGAFRSLRDLGADRLAEPGCGPLRALLRGWFASPDRGRVIVAVVPWKEDPDAWLGRGISIRNAAASIEGAAVRMVVLRDDDAEQDRAMSYYAGADLLSSVYILPRSPMVEVGKLLRSWTLDRPLIVIVDSLAGIVPPQKCWTDGPDYRNWWTMGKHLVTMLAIMQQSMDLQPFPHRIALVVMLREPTFEGLSDEYRDAMLSMFPVTWTRR